MTLAAPRRLLLKPNSTGGDPQQQDPAAVSVHLDSSSVAVTALVLLSALFFFGFFSVYARRFFFSDLDEQSHRRQRGGSGGALSFGAGAPRGVDPVKVRALPTVPYSCGAEEEEEGGLGGLGLGRAADGCVVCLSEFEEGETVKVIPWCGHLFHPQCIDAWLVARGSCPICRSTELFGSGVKVGRRGAGDRSARGVEECELVEVVVVVGGGPGGGAEEEGERGGREGRRELSGLGKSKSWCCLAAEEEAASPPRRSCSL